MCAHHLFRGGLKPTSLKLGTESPQKLFRRTLTAVRNDLTISLILSQRWVNAAVLRIREVYPDPGFDFFHPGSRLQGWQDPGPGSASKNLSNFNPKTNTKFQGCSSRIPDPDFFLSRILDPGVKKAPDPGRLEYRNEYLEPFEVDSVKGGSHFRIDTE